MAKYSYLYHNAALKHLSLYSRVCRSALCRLFMHRTWHSLAGYQGHFPEWARNTWLLPNLFALAYQLNCMCTDWFMRRGGALAFVQSAVWNSVCFSRGPVRIWPHYFPYLSPIFKTFRARLVTSLLLPFLCCSGCGKPQTNHLHHLLYCASNKGHFGTCPVSVAVKMVFTSREQRETWHDDQIQTLAATQLLLLVEPFFSSCFLLSWLCVGQKVLYWYYYVISLRRGTFSSSTCLHNSRAHKIRTSTQMHTNL